MKNNTNIYDIDNELIREAGDFHKWTLEETQEKLKKYNEKIEELEKNDPKSPKLAAYRTYILNLNRYIWSLYSNMTPTQLKDMLKAQETKENVEEQVKNAINELKKEVENETEEEDETDSSTEQEQQPDTVQETSGTTQESLLTDGEGRPETVMDEYVDFEEVKE